MGGGISDVDRGISPGSRATLLQQTGAPPPAVDTGLRMTGDAKRTTEKSDPFADLEGEANFIELNSQLSQAKTEKERNKISERLERWAAYYEAPDHRGEIYDIMTEFVLPSLKDQLKLERIQNIRMNRLQRREDYVAGRFGRLEIVGDTYEEEQPSGPGVGAGSYAPHELTRKVTGTIRIMVYDFHDAVLTPGRTWSETSGVAESVDWFGIEDLVLWPKLLFDLGKFAARALPKVVKFGGQATFQAGKLLYSSAKTITKAGAKIFARRNWKALLKLEEALAELANVMVRLGAGKAKSFEQITAAEACKRLFSQTLSSIPRLAAHWPKDLAKQYVEEIKAAIMDGVKRSKVAQEIANDLAKGRLSRELLEKLPQNLRNKVKGMVEARWDTIRTAFWRNVVDDAELLGELEKMGMKFGKRGAAPVLKIGGKELKITLDHVARKVENRGKSSRCDFARKLRGQRGIGAGRQGTERSRVRRFPGARQQGAAAAKGASKRTGRSARCAAH